MKNILPFFFFIISFYSFNSHAQTGPGGVGTNDGSSPLQLWLRADDLDADELTNDNPSNGASVSTWNDFSGNGNNFISTGSNPPTYNTGTFNSVDFLATSNNVMTPNSFQTFAGGTIFFTLNGSDGGKFSNTLFNDSSRSLRLEQYFNTGRIGYTRYGIQDHTSSLSSIFNSDGILSYDKQTGSNNITIGRNNTSTSLNISGSPLFIGTLGRNGVDEANYDMYEVIVYNSRLNTAQRIIVENYLSAKYGSINILNDLYSQDNSGNGNFDHDVAGIGQATDGTNHTDSRGTGIVRINTPSALSNGDFLFWGEETKDPTYVFSNDPVNYTEQLSSKWRVSKVNDLGTVTVAFDITGMDLSGKQSCQPLQLVVDNHSDFSSPTVYDLTVVGTTATATGVSFTDGDYFTLRYLDQIVWNGTSFFHGSGTANAPDDTDECLKFTVKSGATGTLTFDAHVREIEVESGGTITVSDGILLEVEDQVNINGVVDLLGEAQLIQNHTSATSNSGMGELRIRQQGTVNLHNYNYWSAPVNRSGSWQIGYLEDANGVINYTTAFDANPATSPITLSNHWLYDFNAVSGEYAGWNSLSTTDNITPGRGYTMKGSGVTATEQEYIFKGIPNDGNYSYTVVANNDFLIGNPYPSALDADQFINDNLSIIDGTLHFWEHFSSNNSHNLADYQGGYATYNLMMGLPAIADDSGLTSGSGTSSKGTPTGNIAVGQGFFVTIDTAGSLVFNNGQRTFAKESLNETVYYRNGQPENTATAIDDRTKIWFSFKEPADHVRVIGLGYDTNATLDYDKGYDAKTYDDQRNELYWILNDEELSILALPQFDTTQELPLGIKIADAGLYNFSIDEMENVPSDATVYLKDIRNDTYYNLSTSDATIWLDTGVDHMRFSIVFQESSTLAVDEEFLGDVFLVYDEVLNLLTIKNLQKNEIKQLSIYNTIGQLILDKNKKNNSLQIDIGEFQNGVYF
ncbi:hypothetical protein KAOT1_03787 [Kordia algicida OT-1]|uniref:DUF8202 domain-containing protein n=2 Tax=Kordia TaxID=221065 RepID=A9DW24_9FLAO|nr:T9SS type A sorting domain-containing protein [Kordia algicida]EDP96500.1 hypothetical protein KAOT1_03787 [Kordia algicida OT-1]